MRLVVLGDLNLDVFARVGEDLRPGDEARSRVHVEPGGSAGTFARVAAAHGADVVFLGSVGRDLAGDLLERSLVDAGVTARLARSDRPTGTILALQQGEERSMICSRGANDGLTPDAINPAVFVQADHLHISGYALLSKSQLAATVRAIELAKAHALTVSVDPPPANLIATAGVDRFLRLLEPVDWLFPNLAEGRILSGAETPEAIVDALAARFEAGALTLGPDGALGWQGADRARTAAEPVPYGENTGAGDTFAGAFVVALHTTGEIGLATDRACVAARGHVLRLGDRVRP